MINAKIIIIIHKISEMVTRIFFHEKMLKTFRQKIRYSKQGCLHSLQETFNNLFLIIHNKFKLSPMKEGKIALSKSCTFNIPFIFFLSITTK